MAIHSLSVSFLENANGLYYILIHFSDFELVSLNFEFRCTQFQLALVGLFFVSVDSTAGFADLANLADSLIDLLSPQFDLDMANLSCFGKLTTIFFFISSMFLALSSKFLISV